jgi:diguanylate cyclase (GGDEF)-like protein
MKRDPSHEIAVLFLDVDRFKTINDTFGHQAGDRFLVLFARRLATCLRPHDVLARLGGDEFTILLEGITGVHGACVAAERILDALAEPFRVDDWEMQGSTSIGIVLGAPGYEDPEAMLRDADIAMYRAKQAGGGCYEVFARERHLRTG